jgi:hypothetical protein
MKLRIVCLVVGFLLSVFSLAAQTSGSSPASAQVPPLVNFSGVLSNSASAASGAAPALTGTGTKDYVPLWLSPTKLGSSKLFQTGGKVGIGTKTPAATLDVNGTVNAATSFNLGGTPFAFGSYNNFNAFLGFAGNSTMTGVGNTAAGLQALNSNSSGEANTASGFGTLYSNSTGSFNAASGAYALGSNTTGSGNTASGTYALTSNTTGFDNTATGSEALYSNTTGSPNDAFGYQVLYHNTVGSYNVGVGYDALFSNVGDSAEDGWYNTAVGIQALYSNTTGAQNTAGGYQALQDNTSGFFSTAFGLAALQDNTTGFGNTAVGELALAANTTGSYLTCVGVECSAAADGLSNATAIGAHARVGASNSLVLGGTGKWAVKVGIGTTKPSNILTIARGAGHPVSDGWETFSSRRWKTNIQTLDGALGKVEQLRGVSYDLKANGKHEVGVIAEEVGAVVPEVVTWDENGKDAQSVDYSRLTALLIEATKEQQRQIQQGQAQLAKALRQIKQQQSLLRAQAADMQSLKAEVREGRETLRKVKAQVAASQLTMVAAK